MDARPIDPDSSHGAEASTEHRVDPGYSRVSSTIAQNSSAR
jgi:hypothetical protein